MTVAANVAKIFTLPKFTTEDYRKAKADYVAEHGYTVHLPGFSDIIKIGVEKPMTVQETQWWSDKAYGNFSEERMEEIRWMKKKRFERFKRMLASPTPDLLTNWASVMTALDNVEDAVSTLAVIGRIVARVLPRQIGKLIIGPVGWLMTAAAFLDLARTISSPLFLCRGTKRMFEELTSLNPMSSRARLSRARRLKKILPTLGEWLEAGQVTNDIFGYGICLGPVMGFMMDAISGTYRALRGQEVHIKVPDTDWPHHRRVAHAVLRHAPLIQHFQDDISFDDHVKAYLAINLSWQVAGPYIDEIHPIDVVDGLMNVELPAPQPGNILTREVITEAGFDILDGVGWPGSSRRFTTFNQLIDKTAVKASGNFKWWCQRNKHDWFAWVAATNAVEATLRSLGHAEVVDELYWEDTCLAKSFIALHNVCLSFKKTLDDERIEELHRDFWRYGIIRFPPGLSPLQEYYWKSWTHQPGYPSPWFTLLSCRDMAEDRILRECEQETPIESMAYFIQRFDPCFQKTGNPTWKHYANVTSPIYAKGQ